MTLDKSLPFCVSVSASEKWRSEPRPQRVPIRRDEHRVRPQLFEDGSSFSIASEERRDVYSGTETYLPTWSGQNSISTASFLLPPGQERHFMVQEHFCSVLLSLPCKALHKITQTANRIEQMAEAISPDTLGLPLPLAQCSHFSNSPWRTISGSPRSWMVRPMRIDAYLIKKENVTSYLHGVCS